MARGSAYKVIRTEPRTATSAPPKKSTHAKGALTPSDMVLTTAEIRQRIANLFAARKYDPIKEMVDLVMATNDEGNFIYPADFRLEIHKELAPYIAPKLKAQEITEKVDMSITINVVKFGDNSRQKVALKDGPAIDV